MLFLALASIDQDEGFAKQDLLKRERFTRDGSRALVSEIRARLQQAGFPDLIETKRGIGYRIVVAPMNIELDPALEGEPGNIGNLAGRLRIALEEERRRERRRTGRD